MSDPNFKPRVVASAILVQIAPETFLHFNLTLSATENAGGPRSLQCSVIGRPPSPEKIRRVAQVIIETMEGFANADLEPRLIITGGTS